MVLPISQFLTRSTSQTSIYENRPLFTSIPTSWGISRINNIISDYRLFWQKFRQSPELVAVLSIPITDILGDRLEWVDESGEELGRNKRLSAEKFWRDNQGKETLRAFLFDLFLTGDGFLWKAYADKESVLRAVKEVLKKKNYKLDRLQIKELVVKAVQDEDMKKPKKFDYVASSTVKIIHDEFEIYGYEQQANGKTSQFDVEEIIHHRYMTLNGMVRGFSPVESLASELLLLQLVKGNMISFMQNGGTPDKVFILPKEMANSKNHNSLIDALQKYKKIENKHGNLVFTGEIDIKDLQVNPKDLEYKDLALYITSNLAFVYGIPVSRIPYLIGNSATKGDSGGLSESGYWNRISDMQDTIEDVLNNQLFSELGWHIKFQRKYKQDEVREAQTSSMNADTVTKYQTILMKNQKQLKVSKVLNLLGMHEEDIEEFIMDPMQQQEQTNLMNQNMLDNSQMNNEPDKQKKNQTKRNVANQKGSAEAVTQP
jgi:HK97 family phage portal protein